MQSYDKVVLTVSGLPDAAVYSAPGFVGDPIGIGVQQMELCLLLWKRCFHYEYFYGYFDLQDLYLNLSPDFGGSIDLDLYLTAQSGDKFASSQASFTISVEAVADAPSLTAAVGGSGSEDGKAQDQSTDIAKVTLAAQLNDADGSEKLFFDFSGLSNTTSLIAPDGKKFAVSSDGSASVEIVSIMPYLFQLIHRQFPRHQVQS